jgi:Lon-like ATP-dependent protease
MTESTELAHIVAKSILLKRYVNNNILSDYNIHLHAPGGGVPKEGPSAGVTMATALVTIYKFKEFNKEKKSFSWRVSVWGKR